MPRARLDDVALAELVDPLRVDDPPSRLSARRDRYRMRSPRCGPEALRIDPPVEDGRAQAALVLADGPVGAIGPDEHHLAVAGARVVGLDDQVKAAVGWGTGQAVRVAKLGLAGREDQHTVVVSVRQRLMAAKGAGLCDRHHVVAASGTAPGGEHDSGVLPRAEGIVAADTADGVEVDAGGGELHLSGGFQDVALVQGRQLCRHRDALLSPLVVGDREAFADLGVIAARREPNRPTGCLRWRRACRARAAAGCRGGRSEGNGDDGGDYAARNRPRRPPAAAHGAGARSIHTSAPPPPVLRAPAPPPWACAIALTIASPSPVPSPDRATSARRNRSKACGRKSEGKPGPSSLTWISMRPSALSDHTRTVPPPYRSAFSTRFPSACSSRIRSASTAPGEPSAKTSERPSRSARPPRRSRRVSKTSGIATGSSCSASSPLSERAMTRRDSASCVRRSASSIAEAMDARSSSLVPPYLRASSSSALWAASGVLSSWLASSTNARSRWSALCSRSSIAFRVTPSRRSSSCASGTGSRCCDPEAETSDACRRIASTGRRAEPTVQ